MPKDLTARSARQLFTKHGGTLRTSEALRLGIHPRTLYALRGSGEIEQVARGVYRLASAPPLSNPDWAAIMSRLPRAVICLISALAHHGLTTQVPHATDIALSSHSQIPRMGTIPIRVFWFSEPSFSAGVEAINIDRIPVRIYSAEKTIADCFKYRNKIGLDVAVEALRAYREKKKRPDYNSILEFARVNRVQKIIMPYMEALL
jgi:predicted transcriptional regulator of viral defense system